MTDLILQVGASKLAISAVLAVGILVLTRRVGRPALAHALWLLLLGALLVPPLVSIPLFPPQASPPAVVPVAGFLEVEPTVPASSILLGWLKAYGPSGLIWLWFLGTASVLGWTLVRALRFHGSLVRASAAAPVSVQRMARRISGKLGLKTVPAIHTTDAQLSPMVWWAGGKVRVLLPSTLIAEMDAAELRCVLVHELAHIRRRDHLVRWLEWLACTAFWWNPVAWWARRKLRAAEELCCDALALASSQVSPRAYARSLLRAIDLVSDRPAATAPAFASTAHGRERVNSLEQRFRMIVADTPSPSLSARLRLAIRCGALCLLAVGLVYCTDGTTAAFPDASMTPADPRGGFTHDSRAESGRRPLAAELNSHIDSLAAAGQLTRDAAESFNEVFVPRLADLGASINLDENVPQEFDIWIRISGRDHDRRAEAAMGNLIGLQKALALANGLDPQEMFVSEEAALGGRTIYVRGLTMGAHLHMGGPDECSVELHDRADVSRVSCETWSEVSIPEFEAHRSR